LETGEPALVTTRAELIPALKRDLDRLGLDDTGIVFVATEQLGGLVRDAKKKQRTFSPSLTKPRIADSRRFAIIWIEYQRAGNSFLVQRLFKTYQNYVTLSQNLLENRSIR